MTTRSLPGLWRRLTVLGAVLVALLFGLQAPPRVARAAFGGGNGKVVFDSDRNGRRDIFVMNADGTGQTAITTNNAHDTAPRWSPDGTRILFSSVRDNGENDEVYVMNADGSDQTRLTFGPESSGSPAWSPDGTRIVFSSNRNNGSLDIYVMNADGSAVTRLTTDAATDHEPVWSPDGAKILFSSDRDGDFEIFVMNADGSGQTQLTFNAASNDVQPDWSPDGARIAFARGPFGSLELDIWVMNADGSGQTQLTSHPAIDHLPRFSPDGTKLLFSSDRDGDANVYVMNANGQGQTPITDDPGNDVLADWQPVHPSGLVSWWRAEGDARDAAAGNHGTLANGTAFAAGKVGQAFSFDGGDDEIVVPHNTNLNPDTGMTIGAWVNQTSFGHGRPIAQMRTAGNDGGYTFETTHAPYGPSHGLQWVLWFHGDSPGGARIFQTPANVLRSGEWQHVAATFDGKTMRMFVDGVERATGCANASEPSNACVTTRAIDASGDSFVVGRNVVIQGFAWHGMIDELEVYDRALSLGEIGWLFRNPGSAPTEPAADVSVTTTGTPDPVGAGQPLTYDIGVTNDGPSDATNVVITDTLPETVAFVSAGGAGGDAAAWSCSHASGIVTCARATLPAAGVSHVTITVTPTAVGTISNLVGVSADEEDPDPSDNINGATTQVTLVNTNTTLGSTPSPSAQSQAVTLTATVAPATATGLVTFYDGPAVIGTRPLAGGQAVLTTTFLPAGTRSLQALFAGDAVHRPSRSAVQVQIVQAAVQDSFHPAVHYAAREDAKAVAVGDFNGDTRADLAVAVSGGLTVLRGNGDGTFQPAVLVLGISAGETACCYDVAAGDLNADGRTDLAMASDDGVVVVLGTGTGTFLPAMTYPGPARSRAIVLGDVNNDGRVDAVTVPVGVDTVSVWLGLGTGAFQPPLAYAAGAQPTSVALADFNRDGNVDLAVGNNSGATVHVLRGTGTGTFQAALPFNIPGQQVLGIAAHDFNRDGNPDVVVAGHDTNHVHLLIGVGDGTFAFALPYPTGNPRSNAIVVADFFGDTFPDLATANSGPPSNVTVLSGLPGAFLGHTEYQVGTVTNDLAAGDFNGDGGTDLAVANIGGDNVSILLGTFGTTRVDVTAAPAGLSVTVDGSTYTAPHTFYWFPSTTHTIATSSPQASSNPGIRYLFANWSDGGAMSHTVTAPASSTTYSASFTPQYLLTTVVLPPGGGTTPASPPSPSGFYNPGTVVQVTATPTAGYTFASWAGDLSGSANPQSVTMSLPRFVIALFQPPPCAVNVTGSVDIVRGGFRQNMITGRWIQGVTVRNRTGASIPGPVALVLDNLGALTTLFNATGATACAAPAGSPFIAVGVGADGVLSPGESASVTLEFTSPGARISYTPRALAGANR